jgi:hypothetical protein
LLLSSPDDAIATITLDCHAKQPKQWIEVLHVEPFAEADLNPTMKLPAGPTMMLSSTYNAKT